MSEDHERLVRADLERLGDRGDALCRHVFDSWLGDDEAARRCFEQNSFSSKREMLDTTLVSVYDLLEGASWLKWNLAAYGARHAGVYLVSDGMYDGYARAIVDGLRNLLAPDFDDAHADAWRAALARVCEGMKRFHSIDEVASIVDRA